MVLQTEVPILLLRLVSGVGELGSFLPILAAVFGFCFVLKVTNPTPDDQRKDSALTSRMFGHVEIDTDADNILEESEEDNSEGEKEPLY